MSITWRELAKGVYLHLKPKRMFQVVELASFGIVAMQVQPTSSDSNERQSPSAITMHNSPCRYLRIGGPSLSELTYAGAFKRRKFGLIRLINPHDLLADIQGKKPVWLLVIRGRIKHSAGDVQLPPGGEGVTQAIFKPIFKMESALACTYEEANKQQEEQHQAP